MLTRNEIENYFIDSLGLNPSDFEDYTTKELIEILKENGEYQYCLDYNNKSLAV